MAGEPGVGGDDHEVLAGDGDDGPPVVRVGAEPPLRHAIVVVAQASRLSRDLLDTE